MLDVKEIDDSTAEVEFTTVYSNNTGVDANISDFSLTFYSDSTATVIVDPHLNVNLNSYDKSTGKGGGIIKTIKDSSIVGVYTIKLFLKGEDIGLNTATLTVKKKTDNDTPHFDKDGDLNVDETVAVIENKFIAVPDKYTTSNSWQIDNKPIIHFKISPKSSISTALDDISVKIYNKDSTKEITLLEATKTYDDSTNIGTITLDITRDNRPELLKQEGTELSIYVLRKGKLILNDKLTIAIINNPRTTEAGQYYDLEFLQMDTVTLGKYVAAKYYIRPFTDINNGKYPQDKTFLHFTDVDGYTFLASEEIKQLPPFQGSGYQFEGSITPPAELDTTLADLFGIKFKWAVTSGDNHEYLGHLDDVNING